MSTKFTIIKKTTAEFLCKYTAALRLYPLLIETGDENQFSVKDVEYRGKVKDLPDHLKLKEDVERFNPDDYIYVLKGDPGDLPKKYFFASLHYIIEPVCLLFGGYTVAKMIIEKIH
jgi:hypothetical protein